MNNADFREHFVSFCKEAKIDDYQGQRYLVIPVEETGKPLLSADDCFKRLFLPRERRLSFDEMLLPVHLEGGVLSPLDKVLDTGESIVLQTSLRLRKAESNVGNRFYPFSMGMAVDDDSGGERR